LHSFSNGFRLLGFMLLKAVACLESLELFIGNRFSSQASKSWWIKWLFNFMRKKSLNIIPRWTLNKILSPVTTGDSWSSTWALINHTTKSSKRMQTFFFSIMISLGVMTQVVTTTLSSNLLFQCNQMNHSCQFIVLTVSVWYSLPLHSMRWIVGFELKLSSCYNLFAWFRLYYHDRSMWTSLFMVSQSANW